MCWIRLKLSLCVWEVTESTCKWQSGAFSLTWPDFCSKTWVVEWPDKTAASLPIQYSTHVLSVYKKIKKVCLLWGAEVWVAQRLKFDLTGRDRQPRNKNKVGVAERMGGSHKKIKLDCQKQNDRREYFPSPVDTVRPFKAPRAVEVWARQAARVKTLNSEDKPKVFYNKTDWKELQRSANQQHSICSAEVPLSWWVH